MLNSRSNVSTFHSLIDIQLLTKRIISVEVSIATDCDISDVEVQVSWDGGSYVDHAIRDSGTGARFIELFLENPTLDSASTVRYFSFIPPSRSICGSLVRNSF